MTHSLESTINHLYQKESRRVLATLIRLLKDFDLAEEALHDAFAAALSQWPQEGVPDNPRAWLVSAGRFKAIDQIRKRVRQQEHVNDIALLETLEAEARQERDLDAVAFNDDSLRLIFTCCHPGLSTDAQLALTLREVCGLTTEQIARAFLTSAPTLAQRIVRAKNKIRDANIPYEIPEAKQLPERLQAVLHVIYLLYNEGYSASEGDALVRHELTGEAIHLGRQLNALLPHAEVQGLLALMLLQDARRKTRTDAQGDIVLLENQDRSQWDGALIMEGARLVTAALRSQQFGSYSLQAAIAAVHAEAPSAHATDWQQIVGLYDALLQLNPSPVVALNRAVALSMAQGPAQGLNVIDELLQQKALKSYHLAHAARADCLRRMERWTDALTAYETALQLTALEPEKRFLNKRIEQCRNQAGPFDQD